VERKRRLFYQISLGAGEKEKGELLITALIFLTKTSEKTCRKNQEKGERSSRSYWGGGRERIF